MKKVISLLLVLAMVFSLAACGTKENAANNAANEVPANNAANTVEPVNNEIAEYYLSKANEVQVTADSVIVKDDSGRDAVTLKKNPQKVAVLYGSLVCLWYEAGGTTPLTVGGKSAVTLYEEQIGRDITKDEGVKVITTSSSGSSWDIESIIAEKPDLIVTSVGMKGFETMSGPAQAAGIPCIGIDYDAVQDYLKWFKVFCNLTGHPELWESVANQTASEIVKTVSSVPKNAEQPTAVILLVSSNQLKAYGNANQPGMTLKELGGKNLVDPDPNGTKNTVDISMEELYAMNPKFIFYSARGLAEDPMQELMDVVGNDNAVWKSLDAVKNGNVLILPKGLFFNKANRRYAEAYQTMYGYLYEGKK